MKQRLATLFWVAMVAFGLPPAACGQTPGAPTAASRSAPATIVGHPAGKASRAAAVDSGPALVDINSADEKALDALPGVGPVRAKAVIANRPYSNKQDLVTRKVLPANVFAGIDGMIALANVNTASAADMAKTLPNVGPVRAEAIVKNRPYANPQDLVAKGALTPAVFASIKSLVTTK